MKRLEAGTDLDGFLIGPCLHAGGMAHIYEVTYADARPVPFPMVMKVFVWCMPAPTRLSNGAM